MAQRYVPNYMQGQQRGWNSPRLYGGGTPWGGGLRGPMFQAPLLIQLSPAAAQQPPTGPEATQATQPGGGEAVVSRRNADIVTNPRTTITKEKRKFRYSGMLLCTIASAIMSLGVSNIVITALSVMTSQGDLGCFDVSNPQYNTLGPSSSFMKAFDWSWVSSGLWTAILVYVGGNVVGSIVNFDSLKTRVFSVIALTSLVVLIPISLIFSILDAILSDGCRDSNPTKFGTPIAIAILSVFEFATLIYIVIKFRREIRNSVRVDGSVEDPAPTPTATTAASPIQQTSFGGFPPAAPVPREPNVTLINIQPPAQASLPVPRPYFAPSPYVVLNRPVPKVRWQPRPVGRPDYLMRWAGRPAGRAFPSSMFPSMAQGAYARNAY